MPSSRPAGTLRAGLYIALVLAIAALASAAPADASLILSSPDETSGTGLGAVNTVLTVQANPTESGCVGWDGSMTVTGPAACPPGIAGGDETAINEARRIGDLGISSAFNLRIVFNFNENNADNITLEDLHLRIFSPAGAVLFDSGPFTPHTFLEPFSGTGTAGFVYRLDAQQALQAQPFFDPDNRIGLAAELSQTSSGPETFFVADASAVSPAEADVGVTKSDSPDPVLVGSTLTYTLTVENFGPNTATDVNVTDTLPASVTYQSATPSQGSCSQSGRIVTCSLGDLRPGESVTITIEVTPNADGVITNDVAVAADQPDPDTSNNTDSEQTTVGAGSPDLVNLAITKTDSPDPVDVGDTLTYTLTVDNLSMAGTATGVTVTDALPQSVIYQSATPSQGTCSQSGQTVICDLGSLASGASATITIEVTPQTAGQITNNASTSADQPDADSSDNSATEQTQVGSSGPGAAPSADLAISKTDTRDPVGVGEVFSYTINVDNAGPADATGVEVIDTLPAEVSFVSVTSTQGSCAESGGVVTCDLGTLASGAAATATITVRAKTVGTADDTAAVSANESDPAPGNNQESEETEIVAAVPPIPTVGEWGLLLLALLLAGAGALVLARRS